MTAGAVPARAVHSARSAAIPIGVFLAVLALALAPVFIAGPIPAMVDYPNHLARMSVLARAGTATANPFYQVAWGLYPNLAMDLVVPPLARVFGVEAATRAFLLLSQLLIVSGAVAIEWVVKRRFAFAGAWAALLLYADPFAWGFLNFEFGLGIGLLAFAVWMASVDRPVWRRLLFHSAVLAVLFVSHLFALGLYGWAVGVYELWRWRRDRLSLGRLAGTGLLLGLPVVCLLLATSRLGGKVGGLGVQWNYPAKLLFLLCLNGYSLLLSKLLSLTLFVLVFMLARRRRLALTGPGPALAVGFGVLFLVMPHELFDTEFVDVRVVVAAYLILPAFIVVRPMPARWRWSAIGVLAAVGATDLAEVARVQASYRDDYAAVVASFTRLPPNARVLVGHSGAGDDPPADLSQYPMYHAPVMAVHFADAFVPTLFTYPGKQPILPRPSVRPISVPQGGPVPIAMLAAIARGQGGRYPQFIVHWTRDFDALYLVGPRRPNPLPLVLAETASGPRFAMYRIVKPGGVELGPTAVPADIRPRL